MAAAMAKYAAAELAASGDCPESHPALVDRRLRRTALSAARLGLEAAYRADASDGGGGDAPGCAECGARMRPVRREDAPVESAVGRVRVSMARHACDACGTSVRPRERALDIEGSMTPAARRMASLAGSSCCYAEADGLLAELADVNFGAKRIERTTRSVGDDAESRRAAALEGSITVAAGAAGGGPAARKSLKEGEILCVALDGTGVPARPSETVGRAGRNGGRAGTREAKVGVLWRSSPTARAACARRTARCLYFPGVESSADDARRLAGGGACCANWRRVYAPDDVRECIGQTAAWLRLAVRRVVRTRSKWSTTSTRRSTCGRRRAPATGVPTRRNDRSGSGCSRPAAPTRSWRHCAVPAAANAARRPAISTSRDRMRYDEDLASGLPIGSGRDRGGLQDGRRTASEVHRHALDRGRREPRPVGALRAAERLVRRLLGRTDPAGRVTVSAHSPSELSYTRTTTVRQPSTARSAIIGRLPPRAC